MKTILWAALSANGNYAQSSPENPPKPEALQDFVMQARSAGNFIVGRRTFIGMLESSQGTQNEQTANPFAGLDIVVLSQSVKEIPGVKVVESPQAALAYLQAKDHTTALLSGGADLHNTFLAQGLVDEVIFDISPVFEGKGLNLLLDQDRYLYKNVQLLDCKPLGSGVVQLRYSLV